MAVVLSNFLVWLIWNTHYKALSFECERPAENHKASQESLYVSAVLCWFCLHLKVMLLFDFTYKLFYI